MLKGIIVDTTRDRAESIKNTLNKRYKIANFDIIEMTEEPVRIIDTRNADMVLVSMGNTPIRNIIENANPLVNNIIESSTNIIRMRINNEIKYINKDRILCFEVMGRNSYIYTQRNKYALYRQALNQVLEQIDDPYFVRCHKSYALNIKNLEDVKKERRGIWNAVFKQKTDVECPISGIYYDSVMRKHEEWISTTEKFI